MGVKVGVGVNVAVGVGVKVAFCSAGAAVSPVGGGVALGACTAEENSGVHSQTIIPSSTTNTVAVHGRKAGRFFTRASSEMAREKKLPEGR